MKFSWKIAAPILCLAVICGAAIAWKFYEKRKADELKLVEAARVCRVSAEQGDAKAQYRLGYMYSHGQGVSQDTVEAVRWYRKSADQGNAMGESALASMYSKGRGIEQNYNEALNLYRKSADQDYAIAQYCLGQMYYYGEGVPQDNAEAARWYRKAADRGYANAQYNLGYMYYNGYGVLRDRAEAERWYHKAADQGDEYAQLALGMRIPLPNAYGKVSILLAFLGGLFLSSGLLSPGWSLSNQQQRIIIIIGMLFLFYAGFSLFGIFCIGIFKSVIAVNAFYFTKDFIGGILAVMFLSILLPKRVWPKSAKIALGIFGVLFILFNLLNIYLYYKLRIAQVFRCFSMGNGLLLGTLIPLAIFLWRNYKKSSNQQNGNGDEAVEIPAENESELNQKSEECSHAG